MTNNKNNSIKKGFTLIEIVIVLAIAALIMVIVFLAVQGAQRGQRDQARKDYANQGLAKIQEFAGNNGGSAAGISVATFGAYMGNRTINGQAPTITIPAAPPANNTTCTRTAPAEVVQITGAAVSTTNQVAVCLESNVFYVARVQ